MTTKYKIQGLPHPVLLFTSNPRAGTPFLNPSPLLSKPTALPFEAQPCAPTTAQLPPWALACGPDLQNILSKTRHPILWLSLGLPSTYKAKFKLQCDIEDPRFLDPSPAPTPTAASTSQPPNTTLRLCICADVNPPAWNGTSLGFCPC